MKAIVHKKLKRGWDIWGCINRKGEGMVAVVVVIQRYPSEGPVAHWNPKVGLPHPVIRDKRREGEDWREAGHRGECHSHLTNSPATLSFSNRKLNVTGPPYAPDPIMSSGVALSMVGPTSIGLIYSFAYLYHYCPRHLIDCNEGRF